MHFSRGARVPVPACMPHDSAGSSEMAELRRGEPVPQSLSRCGEITCDPLSVPEGALTACFEATYNLPPSSGHRFS